MMNINNFGLNPGNMNNNWMLGMNPQPNLMNNYQIQQYENRIKQLEKEIVQYKELIIQKDLELNSLKKKTNNNNIIERFYQKNGEKNINKDDKVTIMIQSNIKMPNFNKKEKAVSLLDIFQNMSLTLNYRPIQLNKTLEDNEIYDGSIINISNSIFNLHFKSNQGNHWIIYLDGDCPFRQAIIFFCKESKIEDIYQKVLEKKVWFIYCTKYLDNVLDETPINKIFSSIDPVINVML